MNFHDIGEITWAWVERTFGSEIAYNNEERALRLLEETLEAYQTLGGDKDHALRLVHEVFGRPYDNDYGKELAQVGMIFAALCSQMGLDPMIIVRDEMMRVLAVDPKKPRARMLEKIERGVSHARKNQLPSV